MELHKKIQKQYNVDHSKSLVITGAVFPNGFVKFMEALVRDGVVAESYTRKEGAIGIRWNDTRELGGLLIETEKHPLTGSAGTVVFEGVRNALDLVRHELEIHGVEYSDMRG